MTTAATAASLRLLLRCWLLGGGFYRGGDSRFRRLLGSPAGPAASTPLRPGLTFGRCFGDRCAGRRGFVGPRPLSAASATTRPLRLRFCGRCRLRLGDGGGLSGGRRGAAVAPASPATATTPGLRLGFGGASGGFRLRGSSFRGRFRSLVPAAASTATAALRLRLRRGRRRFEGSRWGKGWKDRVRIPGGGTADTGGSAHPSRCLYRVLSSACHLRASYGIGGLNAMAV